MIQIPGAPHARDTNGVRANHRAHANLEESLLLRGDIIRKWGVALAFERNRKKLSVSELASRVGTSSAEIVRWQNGKGAPTGKQQPRLYASLPLLKNYKHLLPSLAVKAAEVVEATRERTGVQAFAEPEPPPVEVKTEVPEMPKPPPVLAAPKPAPPAPPPPAPAPAPPARSFSPGTITFGRALRMARVVRGWDQQTAAKFLNVAPSALSMWERDKNAPVPASYAQLLEQLPELKAPGVPTPVGYRKRRDLRELPEALQPVAEAPPPVVERTQPEPPAAAELADEAAALAGQYAQKFAEAKRAAADYDRLMADALAADERRKAAEAQAEDLLRQLKERA